MLKIIAALLSAIQFVTTQKQNFSALKAEVASRDAIIVDLRAQLAAEEAADATIQTRLDEAEASLAAVNAQIDEANAAVEQLVTAIDSDPEIPITIDESGATSTVEENAPETVRDIPTETLPVDAPDSGAPVAE